MARDLQLRALSDDDGKAHALEFAFAQRHARAARGQQARRARRPGHSQPSRLAVCPGQADDASVRAVREAAARCEWLYTPRKL